VVADCESSRVNASLTAPEKGVAKVDYFLERRVNLAVPFRALDTNAPGKAGTTSYADTNATGAGPFLAICSPRTARSRRRW